MTCIDRSFSTHGLVDITRVALGLIPPKMGDAFKSKANPLGLNVNSNDRPNDHMNLFDLARGSVKRVDTWLFVGLPGTFTTCKSRSHWFHCRSPSSLGRWTPPWRLDHPRATINRKIPFTPPEGFALGFAQYFASTDLMPSQAFSRISTARRSRDSFPASPELMMIRAFCRRRSRKHSDGLYDAENRKKRVAIRIVSRRSIAFRRESFSCRERDSTGSPSTQPNVPTAYST